jgi:hypothetical protein
VTEDLVTFHNVLRWLVVVAAVGALVVLFRARRAGGWTHPAYFWCQAYAYAMGVQSILGISIWLIERRWEGGPAFFTWVHPAAMFVAVALAHGGLAQAYRTNDPPRVNRIATASVGASLALVILAIPWFAR